MIKFADLSITLTQDIRDIINLGRTRVYEVPYTNDAQFNPPFLTYRLSKATMLNHADWNFASEKIADSAISRIDSPINDRGFKYVHRLNTTSKILSIRLIRAESDLYLDDTRTYETKQRGSGNQYSTETISPDIEYYLDDDMLYSNVVPCEVYAYIEVDEADLPVEIVDYLASLMAVYFARNDMDTRRKHEKEASKKLTEATQKYTDNNKGLSIDSANDTWRRRYWSRLNRR